MASKPWTPPRRQHMSTQAVMSTSFITVGGLSPGPHRGMDTENAQKLSGERVKKLYIGVVNVELQELLSPRDGVRSFDEPIKIIRSVILVLWFDKICGMVIDILVLIDIWLNCEHYRIKMMRQFSPKRFFRSLFLCRFFINLTATTIYFFL